MLNAGRRHVWQISAVVSWPKAISSSNFVYFILLHFMFFFIHTNNSSSQITSHPYHPVFYSQFLYEIQLRSFSSSNVKLILYVHSVQAKEKQRMVRYRKVSKWAVDIFENYYIRWKVCVESFWLDKRQSNKLDYISETTISYNIDAEIATNLFQSNKQWMGYSTGIFSWNILLVARHFP